jgi:hypothetical protein
VIFTGVLVTKAMKGSGLQSALPILLSYAYHITGVVDPHDADPDPRFH